MGEFTYAYIGEECLMAEREQQKDYLNESTKDMKV